MHFKHSISLELLRKRPHERLSAPRCLGHAWLRKDEVDGRGRPQGYSRWPNTLTV